MNKRILITGGVGFLGQLLIESIYNEYSYIRVTSRNEEKLNILKSKFPNISIVCGDLLNTNFVNQITNDIDLIYHLAGYKYVSLSEKNVSESINGNIITTNNILESISKSLSKVEIRIISTNKVHNIKGVYAATKFLSEKLALSYQKKFSNISLKIIYLTNIFNSPGSITELWKESIINNTELKVTDLKCTRFFLTKKSAVELIKNASVSFPIKSLVLEDLLKAIIFKYNGEYDLKKIKITGLSPSENLHELHSDKKLWSNNSNYYSNEELISII